MLDLVFQGKTAFAIMDVFGGIITAGLLLLLLGFVGLFLTSEKFQKIRPLRWICSSSLISGMMLMALPPALFLYRSMTQPPESIALTLNISSRPRFEQLDRRHCREMPWGNSEIITNCMFQGETTVTLIFPGDISLRQSGKMAAASGRTDLIDSLKLFSVPATAEQAAAMAEELLRPWNSTATEQLSAWREEAAESRPELQLGPISAPENSALPKIQVAVKKLRGSAYEKTPWYVFTTLSWTDESEVPS
jgi:hypothetical protein